MTQYKSYVRSAKAEISKANDGMAVMWQSVDQPFRDEPKFDLREIPEKFSEDYFGIPTLMGEAKSIVSEHNWAEKQRTKPQSFTGKWEFLSNMYLCSVIFGDLVFPSAENAFQAMKCKTRAEMAEFQYITPYEARERGNEVDLRSNWDGIRLRVMEQILRAKFEDQELAEMLLKTEDMYLCELNYWGDTFWGKAPVVIKHFYVNGEEVDEKEYKKLLWSDKAKEMSFNKTEERKIIGENNLGKLLCKIRGEIRESGKFAYYMANYQEKAKVDVDWLVSQSA